jgi:hypothetical protein
MCVTILPIWFSIEDIIILMIIIIVSLYTNDIQNVAIDDGDEYDSMIVWWWWWWWYDSQKYSFSNNDPNVYNYIIHMIFYRRCHHTHDNHHISLCKWCTKMIPHSMIIWLTKILILQQRFQCEKLYYPYDFL